MRWSNFRSANQVSVTFPSGLAVRIYVPARPGSNAKRLKTTLSDSGAHSFSLLRRRERKQKKLFEARRAYGTSGPDPQLLTLQAPSVVWRQVIFALCFGPKMLRLFCSLPASSWVQPQPGDLPKLAFSCSYCQLCMKGFSRVPVL